MSMEMLKQKLVHLEQRIEALEAKVEPAAKSTWEQAFGVMKDDDLSLEATRLGAVWRTEANKKGR